MSQLPGRGFTVIELMVIVAIIGVLSGLSLVGYNRFNERQIVVQAANQLAGDLRLTQQHALSGYKPAGWCSAEGESLYQYRLEFTSRTSYRLRAWCCLDPDGDSSCDSYERQIVRTASLPAGSEKESDPNDVIFYPLTGASSGRTYTLRGSLPATLSYEINVVVTQAGGVSLN